MKYISKERGVIGIDELIEKTDKDSQDPKAYLPFIREGIKKMIESGFRFPFIKKASSPTAKIQVTAHLHISDALQGYWERNKRIYTHRAKSDYRALYLGTIVALEEEMALTGYDNSVEITKLETFLKEKEYRHKANREMAMLRSEIKTCLQERDDGTITEDQFDKMMDELVEMCSVTKTRNRAENLIDSIILEEEKKTGNRNRQSAWRERRKKALGLSVVE